MLKKSIELHSWVTVHTPDAAWHTEFKVSLFLQNELKGRQGCQDTVTRNTKIQNK